jgi:hypothetical protein
MSGSGGSVYDPEPPQTSCDKLAFATILNSPVPAVVKRIKKDDVLDVALQQRGAVQVVVVLHQGDVAGAITADVLPQLISCIENGHEYEAEVRGVAGSKVDVHVRKK